MPNGRPYDNPLTDLFVHGRHPFPPDMEAMLLELRELDPHFSQHLHGEEFAWERGEQLDEGRATLRRLLAAARG